MIISFSKLISQPPPPNPLLIITVQSLSSPPTLVNGNQHYGLGFNFNQSQSGKNLKTSWQRQLRHPAQSYVQYWRIQNAQKKQKTFVLLTVIAPEILSVASQDVNWSALVRQTSTILHANNFASIILRLDYSFSRRIVLSNRNWLLRKFSHHHRQICWTHSETVCFLSMLTVTPAKDSCLRIHQDILT